MKLENKLIDKKFLIFDYILCAIICVANFYDKKNIVSICFYITFLVLIILVTREFRRNRFKVEMNLVILTFLPIACVFINFLIIGGNANFEYFKKVIIFLSSVYFLFYVSTKYRNSWEIRNSIFTITILISMFYIFCFFTNKQECYVMNGKQSVYLTFGMTNPNLLGIYILCLAVYAFYFFFKYKNFFIRIVCFTIFLFMIFFLIETGARNAQLALVVFLIVTLIVILKKMKIPSRIVILMIWYPIIFTGIYLAICENSSIMNHFSFLVSEGKGIDSRYWNWKSCIKAFFNSPIIGAYSQISNGTGVSQMLNTHLDVLASYGIFVFITFISFLNKKVKDAVQLAQTIPQKIAVMGFFAGILAGTGEAAFVSGGTGIYILICGFLLLIDEQKEGNIIDNK